jgi:hypothetical protein
MGRDNQAEMTKTQVLHMCVCVCDTYSSPYHWLINNANQCTYLAKSLDFKRLQCMARLFTDTPLNPQDMQECIYIPNLTSPAKTITIDT